jgi:hypothetical protein
MLCLNFFKHVQDNDWVTAGCLDASSATTVCPISYGYALPCLDVSLGLLACRPSTQTTCSTPTFPTMAVNGTSFNACLSLAAGQPCPATYAVFATINLPYPGAIPAMCLVPGITACPLNFHFQLLDKAVIQGCLPPPRFFVTTCNVPAYQNWRGVSIGDSTNTPLGCATTATRTCPSGYIPLWNTAVGPPAITLCRPQLQPAQTCTVQAFLGLAYTTNARNELNAIIGCLRANQPCPTFVGVLNLPAWVAATFAQPQTNPSDCLPSTLQACPATGYTPPRTIALYRGISVSATQQTLALPRLFGCLPSISNDCSDYGSSSNRLTAEVWSSADATTLAGCAVAVGDAVNGATAALADLAPCPSTAHFFFQCSLAIAADNTGGKAALVECRPTPSPVPATCPGISSSMFATSTIMMRGIDATLLGCKGATLNSVFAPCSPGTTVNSGLPYDINVPMLGNKGFGTPRLVECRRTLNPWPASCNAYLSPAGTTRYPVALLQGTKISAPAAGAGASGPLAGCMAANTRCPGLGEAAIFSCAYAQGAQGAGSQVCGASAGTKIPSDPRVVILGLTAMLGFPIPLISADGSTIEQCRWNGLGGADVMLDSRLWLVPGDLVGSEIEAGTDLRIANVCADQSAYPSTYTVPVTRLDYSSIFFRESSYMWVQSPS